MLLNNSSTIKYSFSNVKLDNDTPKFSRNLRAKSELIRENETSKLIQRKKLQEKLIMLVQKMNILQSKIFKETEQKEVMKMTEKEMLFKVNMKHREDFDHELSRKVKK